MMEKCNGQVCRTFQRDDFKNHAAKPHRCPYQCEINDDPDPEFCTCCDDCETECVDNI